MGTKAITLRGIDDQVSSKLKQLAKAENKSVNKFLLDMIKQNIGMQKKYRKEHHDLDPLFGKWTDDEFRKIQEFIESQRKIDIDLWK